MDDKTFYSLGKGEIVQLKGMLTIMSDTHVVLAPPYGYKLKNEEITVAQSRILEWLKDGGVLLLNFPVEIIDMRNRTPETSIEIMQSVPKHGIQSLIEALRPVVGLS